MPRVFSLSDPRTLLGELEIAHANRRFVSLGQCIFMLESRVGTELEPRFELRVDHSSAYLEALRHYSAGKLADHVESLVRTKCIGQAIKHDALGTCRCRSLEFLSLWR